MNIQNIILAAILVALVVFGGWYILRTRRDDQTEAKEYVDDDGHVKGEARIPITARAKGMSRPAKLMFLSVGLLMVVVAVFAYQTLSTGSPGEILFADQLRTAAIVLVGVVGGIILSNLARRNVGYLYNIYETDSGEVRTEVVPVDISGIDSDSEGHDVVKEYHKQRLFGLFHRYKHVAEDAELDGDHRAPGKVIKHQIADHAVEVEDGKWFQRTSGRNDTKSPSVEPDYIYSAPIELSYDTYLNMKESVRRMEQRHKGSQATIAVIERELSKLRDRLETGKYNTEEAVLERFDKMMGIVQRGPETDPTTNDARSTRVQVEGSEGRQSPPKAATNGQGGDQ